MRAHTPDEDRLIAASLALSTQRQAEERRRQTERETSRQRELAQTQALAAEQTKSARQSGRYAGIVTGIAVLTLIAAIIAGWFYTRAQSESNARATEVVNRTHAQATAEANRTAALNQAPLAKAGELAAASREVAQPAFDPSLALYWPVEPSR